MKTLKNIPKGELELMSYTDIAAMYLKENKTTKNTAELFKVICNLLELPENTYAEQIADFFESLTTSKEFILLENGEWDLKSNHKVKVVIEDIEEDDSQEDENTEDELDSEEEPDDLEAIDDDNYVEDNEDDLSDLTIVNEEELED